jgi:hypothetical protein
MQLSNYPDGMSNRDPYIGYDARELDQYPAICAECESEEPVTVQQVLNDYEITTTWTCATCGHENEESVTIEEYNSRD